MTSLQDVIQTQQLLLSGRLEVWTFLTNSLFHSSPTERLSLSQVKTRGCIVTKNTCRGFREFLWWSLKKAKTTGCWSGLRRWPSGTANCCHTASCHSEEFCLYCRKHGRYKYTSMNSKDWTQHTEVVHIGDKWLNSSGERRVATWHAWHSEIMTFVKMLLLCD